LCDIRGPGPENCAITDRTPQELFPIIPPNVQ